MLEWKLLGYLKKHETNKLWNRSTTEKAIAIRKKADQNSQRCFETKFLVLGFYTHLFLFWQVKSCQYGSDYREL